MRKKNLVRILCSTVLICSLWSIPTFAAEIDLDNIFVTSTAETEPFKAPVDIMQTSRSDLESTLEAVEETRAASETAAATQAQPQPESSAIFPTVEASTRVPALDVPVVPETTSMTPVESTVTVSETVISGSTFSTSAEVESVDIVPFATASETTIATSTIVETASPVTVPTPEMIPQTESVPMTADLGQELFFTNTLETAAPMRIQELLNSDGYSVLKITTRQDVASLRCATWTAEGGQDDIKWTVIDMNGSTESKLYIYDADFMNKAGTYINHIYAYNANGNLLDLKEFNVQITNTNPFLCVDIIENNDNTYTVYVDTTEDIASVACATWTEANGQDDSVWKYQIKDNKYRTTFTIPISEHNGEVGKYINHIYATYKDGTIVGPADITANMVYVEPLSIREIQSSIELYTGSVRTRSDVKTIGVATWTEINGQDDIIWNFYDAVDKKADFIVNRAAHNNEDGKYITHIYAYNYSGDTVGLIGYTISYDK